MGARNLSLCKSTVLFVTCFFLVVGCETYKKYQKPGAHSKNKITTELAKNDGGNSGIPEEMAVGVNLKSNYQKPFLERYEDLVNESFESKRDIKHLRMKILEHESMIDKLRVAVKIVMDEVDKKSGKINKLQVQNGKLMAKYTNETARMNDEISSYKGEIEGLKVKLVKLQISEIKSKQELIKVKTRYMIDKKRWGVKDIEITEK